jgi:hypothetical protein
MIPTPTEVEKAQEVLLEVDSTTEAATFEAKELVRRVLDFANTGKPKGLPGARQTFLVITPEHESQQADLCADLTAIVKGELSGPAVARLRRQARHVMVRSYAINRGALVRKERHFVKDLSPLLADVLLSIYGDQAARADVKQCRLPGCGRFFLASDLVDSPAARGRRRYRFCSQEHMEAGQTSSAKRMAKLRAKIKRK